MRLPLLLAATLGAASVASALPPPTAPPFTGVYRQTVQRKDGGGVKTASDTTTISVSGKRSRWQRASDGQVTLSDDTAGTMTMFGGGLPDKLALETKLPGPTSSWDHGFAGIAADSGPPKELGTASYAGQSCTRLKFESKRFGAPELCVTDAGIVVRFFLDDPEDHSVTTFEAERITPGEPPAKDLAVPEGYTVEKMTPM